MQGKKGNKGNKYLLAALLLIVISVALLAFAFYNRPYLVRTYQVKFMVGDRLGFDLNGSALSFGMVFPGASAEKTIYLDNQEDRPMDCKVFISKNLDGLVFTNSRFVLPAKGKMNLSVELSVPLNFTQGNYSGTLTIEMKKVRE